MNYHWRERGDFVYMMPGAERARGENLDSALGVIEPRAHGCVAWLKTQQDGGQYFSGRYFTSVEAAKQYLHRLVTAA